jgi:hypothetical protein
VTVPSSTTAATAERRAHIPRIVPQIEDNIQGPLVRNRLIKILLHFDYSVYYSMMMYRKRHSSLAVQTSTHHAPHPLWRGPGMAGPLVSLLPQVPAIGLIPCKTLLPMGRLVRINPHLSFFFCS